MTALIEYLILLLKYNALLKPWKSLMRISIHMPANRYIRKPSDELNQHAMHTLTRTTPLTQFHYTQVP